MQSNVNLLTKAYISVHCPCTKKKDIWVQSETSIQMVIIVMLMKNDNDNNNISDVLWWEYDSAWYASRME